MAEPFVFRSKADFYEGSPVFGGEGGGQPGDPEPRITSLVPANLPETAGPTAIAVIGTNFVAESVVKAGVTPQATTYVSATRLTVVYDPEEPGTVDVTVVNPGTGAGALESNSVPFTVLDVPEPPVITALDPTAIPANIASDVVVTGTGFLSAPDMKAWVNGTEMPGAPESDTVFNFSVNFLSSNPEGTSANVQIGKEDRELSNTLVLGILPTPAIASLSPNTAITTDPAATVTVTGTGFLDGAVVQIDGVAQTTTFVSATQLTVSYDPTTAGTKQFTVRHTNGHVSASSPFTVTEPAALPAPTITSLNPATLPADAGLMSITVQGANYVSGAVVKIDGVDALTNFVADNWLTANFDPSVAGDAVFTVTNPDSQVSAGFNLTVTAPAPVAPTITDLSPDEVDYGETVTLTITGTGFETGMAIFIDDVWIGGDVVSSTSMTRASFNSTMPGVHQVTVGVQEGVQSNSLPLTVGAAPPPAPTLTALTPSSVNVADGAASIQLTGTGFTNTMTPFIDGVTVAGFYTSATQFNISAYDATAAGTVQVTIGEPGGTPSNALPLTATVPAAGHTITSISPASLTMSDVSPVITVTGTGFSNGYQITIDGVDPGTTGWVSDTELTIFFQLTAPGTFQLAVKDLGGVPSNSLPLTVTDVVATTHTITALTPNTAPLSAGTPPMSVTGTGFTADMVICANNNNIGSWMTSPTQMDTGGLNLAAYGVGDIRISVGTSAGNLCASLPFTVTPAATVTAQQVHDWGIGSVKDFVRDHPELASEVYELEKAGQARPGILNWLKTLLDEEDTTT